MPNEKISPFLLNTGPPYNPYVGYGNPYYSPTVNFTGSIIPTDTSSNTSSFNYSPYIAAGAGLAAPLLAKNDRTGQTLSAAASGATIGSLFGPVGTAFGAVIGGLYGAFSESPEERRQKRYDEFKKRLNEQRQKTLAEGAQKIGQITSGLTKRFRSGAARRAAALGRTSDVETFELPVVEKVASFGSGAMSDFLTSTNRYFDEVALNAEQQFLLGGELEPTAVDYLSEIAPSALQYMQNKEYLDLLRNYMAYGGG